MRPLKLKIKGLNSFIEIQEIDFVRLTSKGLFGIFGPTGSGKSSILDGITLALYGAVARGSNNFVNTNCESLHVSFEFQITEKQSKRYRVEREFRREKRTGNIRTHSAKILLLTEEGEQVLEEQVREVTRKCEEILGLKLEDFTRTVVLPQGKFSEFLRLEGKDRREMLERLFNLQKYGDELSNRLAGRIRQEVDKANVLEGQLKAYEACSEEVLREKTEELAALLENLTVAREELRQVQENYNQGKEIWELQKELNQYQAQKAQLEQKREEIQAKAQRADLGEGALRVKPYLEQWEDTQRKITETQVEVAEFTKVTEELRAQKQEAEGQLAEARLKKDQELPLLKLREQTVADALEEKAKLSQLNNEIQGLQGELQKLAESLKDTEERIVKGERLITELNEQIQAGEEKLESLRVEPEFKKRINEALIQLSRSEEAEKQIRKLETDIQGLGEKLQEAQTKGETLAQTLKQREEHLQAKELQLQALEEACPGNQETLSALQEKLSQVKEQWSKHKDFEEIIEKNKKNLQELKPKLDGACRDKEVLEQEICALEQELDKLQREAIAHGLRSGLKEGEPCPVCGSKEHPMADLALFDSTRLEEKQAQLKEKKLQAQKLEQEIIKAQENIKTCEGTLEEYEAKMALLGEEYKNYDPLTLQNEYESLKEKLARYTADKAQLEEEIKNLIQEKNAMLLQLNEQTTIQKETQAQLSAREENLAELKQKLQAMAQELKTLQVELGVEDFQQEQKEILRKETEKGKLENELKELREKLKRYQERKAELDKELAALKEALSKSTAILNEKENAHRERAATLKAKVGELEDLEEYQRELAAQIKHIEQKFEEAEKKKQDLEQRYNEAFTRLQASQYSLESLQERREKDRRALEKALAQEQFKDLDEVKGSLLEKEEIHQLRQEVKEYQNSLTQLAGALENLGKRLGERRLTEEEWQRLQKLKEDKELSFKGLEESKIKLETTVKSLQENLSKKQALLQEQAQLDRLLGRLRDLEKLFRGKRFVEFVAAHQLKYVSLEASKRLREITGGNYGLEVDEDGKFFIRDYKNGGAKRDASTLSGGETFLASLALALALSAQIQLKGTAPLELFFLDEGFGTLDDNLLEVVMDSLERLHHDRLAVGIISHVEAIKNRVPVKLMVTPAQAGMGGSKVSIEVS